jgi:glycosyltransferase involved in cell wall biosynthesis
MSYESGAPAGDDTPGDLTAEAAGGQARPTASNDHFLRTVTSTPPDRADRTPIQPDEATVTHHADQRRPGYPRIANADPTATPNPRTAHGEAIQPDEATVTHHADQRRPGYPRIANADPTATPNPRTAHGEAIRGESWIVVVEEPFLPVDAGGRVETFTFLTAAAAAGIRLKVLVPARETLDVEFYEKAIPGAAFIALPRDHSPLAHLTPRPFIHASRPGGSLRRALARTPRQADVVISYSVRSAHLGEHIAEAWRIPHLVRAHNIDSEFFRALARSSSGPRAAACTLEYYKLRRAEHALHHSELVTCIADISIDDHEWRRTRASVRTFHLPPFLPASTLTAGQTRADGERIADRAVFVGSLDTPTNIEALRWFLGRCWPALRARRPGASLDVVGRRADAELLTWLRGHDGVRVHTDVPSVAGFVAAASISLNPMRSGSGVNIKVIEAMAAATPVVSTGTGSRGLAWRPERDILVAETPAEFVEAACRLLADPALARKIGAAGREFVTAELDWVRLVETIRTNLATRSD